tara:strand:- start:30 stop:602 length:573 start_codon:yes stop_codon:yes gene_type:complete
MQIVKLFPKIIGVFKNPDTSYHQKIVKKCYTIKDKTYSGGKNWLSKVYNVSGKLNLYKEKDFKPLLKWIDEQLLEYINNLNINFKPSHKNAWFQIYGNSDYQDYHSHPSSKLSAIYFLKGKNNSAPVLFTDFNFNMNYFNIITPTEDNSCEWNIPFQEGVLLIFRSEIPHCVPKNNTSERITIAINYEYI